MLKKYLKIYLHFFKMNILKRMAHRLNFFIVIMVVSFNLATYIIFIKVIYGHLNLIAGWDLYHSLLIIASIMIIEWLAWITCGFMNDLNGRVRTGNLDGFIVKPIDAQLLVSINRIDPEDSARFFIAMIVFVYALKHIETPSIAAVVIYACLIICAYLIFYSIIVLLNTISFWVIDIRGLTPLGERLLHISQYPTDIYTGIMRTVFSFIIPIAFIATVPAKVLSGWYDWKLVLESFIIAGIFFYASRKFFLFGLRHYSSASS
ncbi:MAG: ABC-2 family transporter protein [bacterium]